jgi:tetratricopeptide (TPR) repeat protein
MSDRRASRSGLEGSVQVTRAVGLLWCVWLGLALASNAHAQSIESPWPAPAVSAAPAPPAPPTPTPNKLDEARLLREAGRLLDALAAYEEAYRLEPSELALRGLAEVAWLLGDPARAHLCYQMLLREHGATLSPESRAAVERTLAELDYATGTIEFLELPVGARIRLNGLEIGVLPLGPLRLNPGEYQVLVEAEGFRPLTVRVRITSGVATVRGPLEPALNAGTLNITVAPSMLADLVVNGIVIGRLP